MTHVVVFDLDGTLVDTPSAIVEAFTTAFASMGLDVPIASAIRATIGLPLEQAFSRLMGTPLDDDRVAHGVKQYQVCFKELILPRAARLVFPGVAEGLATLREDGCTLALATSKIYASADALLRAAGLRDYFSVVVGADQVTHPKPHPEMLEVIMLTLGISAEQTVMVGDTTHDLLMAKAAGTRSVAVTYGVHSPEELKSLKPTWIADTFDGALTCIQTNYYTAAACG
jgi:phosphoglycolate phosphatase